jgi:hypothetical protein
VTDPQSRPRKRQGKKAAKRATKKAAKKAAKRTSKKAAKKAAKKAPRRTGKKAARKAPARKAPARKAPAKKAGGRAVTKAALPAPEAVERVWLASYPPGVPPSYEYPLVAFTRFLDDAAQDFPHSPAIHFLGSTLTYRELLDQVDRFATALREAKDKLRNGNV